MNKNFDLSNIPNDVQINADGGGYASSENIGKSVDLTKDLVGLFKGGKENKAILQQQSMSLQSQAEANKAAAAASAARIAEIAAQNRASLEQKKADKIMGMSKPAFFGILGVTTVVLVITGVIIYKKIKA